MCKSTKMKEKKPPDREHGTAYRIRIGWYRKVISLHAMEVHEKSNVYVEIVRRLVMSDDSKGLIGFLEPYYRNAMKAKQPRMNELLHMKESSYDQLTKEKVQQDCCNRLIEAIKYYEDIFDSHVRKAAQLTTPDEPLLEKQWSMILEICQLNFKPSQDNSLQKLEKDVTDCIREKYFNVIAKGGGGSISSDLGISMAERWVHAVGNADQYTVTGGPEIKSIAELTLEVLNKERMIAMLNIKIAMKALVDVVGGLDEITSSSVDKMEQEISDLERELIDSTKPVQEIAHPILTRKVCKQLLKDALKVNVPRIDEFTAEVYEHCHRDSPSSQQIIENKPSMSDLKKSPSLLVLQTRKAINDAKLKFYDEAKTTIGLFRRKYENKLTDYTKLVDIAKASSDRSVSSKQDAVRSYEDLKITLDSLSATIKLLLQCSLEASGTPPDAIKYKLGFEGDIQRTTSQMSHTEKEIAIQALFVAIKWRLRDFRVPSVLVSVMRPCTVTVRVCLLCSRRF